MTSHLQRINSCYHGGRGMLGIGLCREPSSRPQDGSLRSRTGGFVDTRPRAVVGKQDGLMPVLGRPNARPRTGCITRRTYFLRIILKCCAWFIIALQSERTSIHSVIGPVVILSLAIKTLAPLHNLASGADYPLDATVCVYTAAQLYA